MDEDDENYICGEFENNVMNEDDDNDDDIDEDDDSDDADNEDDLLSKVWLSCRLVTPHPSSSVICAGSSRPIAMTMILMVMTVTMMTMIIMAIMTIAKNSSTILDFLKIVAPFLKVKRGSMVGSNRNRITIFYHQNPHFQSMHPNRQK